MTGEEGIKWRVFGVRLITLMTGLSLVLGVGLTAVSVVQSTRQFGLEIEREGRSLARAFGEAAFVPLELEDSAALQRLVQSLAGNKDVVSARIEDRNGKAWAEYRRPGSGPEVWFAAQSPVVSREGGDPAGRIVVGMTDARVKAHRDRLLAASAALNGVFVALLSIAGALMIRQMTMRMQELVNEAYWVSELRRSNKELEEFAYIASHDLQAPLRKIAGFAKLLSERLQGKLDEKAETYVTILGENCGRMQALIEALLSYSRAGSAPMAKERANAADLARRAVEDLSVPIGEAGASVRIGTLPFVRADPNLMTIIFRNLISNAVKFRGDKPPKVRVSAERRDGEWEFSVSDNGIGFDARYAERIFEMFRRLHTQEKYHGTGIGLALVRKLVLRHGGRIRAESTPGQGSTFYFTIGGGPP